MIISFSGVDGAGKSTQIDLLCKYLKQNNKQFYYIWSRGGYTSGMEFMKWIVRKILRKGIPSSGKSIARTESLSRPWMSYIWLTAAMLDLIVLYAVVIRFRSLIGEIVICDRYLEDTVLDFKLNFPQIAFENMWLWKLLEIITPKPRLSFLLLMPVVVSMDRSKLKREPFPDDEETLEKRLAIYQSNGLFNDCVKIDATQKVDVISEQIIKQVSLSDAT